MPTELTPDEQIKVLQHEVGELKKQTFVLTDKSNQALIAAESYNAMLISIMEASTPSHRKAVLKSYSHICRQLDACPINQKRTSEELAFQDMVRQSMLHTSSVRRGAKRGPLAAGGREGASWST
jgi:hypothetical protein